MQNATLAATTTGNERLNRAVIEPPLFLFLYWLNGSAAAFTGANAVGVLGLFTLGFICIALLQADNPARPASRPATALHALILMIPSSSVAAVGMAGYAVQLAARSSAPVRYAAATGAALAVTMLWSSVGRNIMATPLITFDAIAVESLFALVEIAVTRKGNILLPQDGHSIIIFADCATAFILPGVVVASAAMSLRSADRWGLRWFLVMASLAIAVLVCNVLRLALLAGSSTAYEIGHGAVGRNLFDALMIGLAMAAASFGQRSATTSPAPARRAWARGSIWPLVVVLLVGLVGFGLKTVRYAASDQNADAVSILALQGFLGSEGWRLQSSAPLIPGTGYLMHLFQKEGCPAPIAVTLLSPEGESADTALVALRDVAFVYDGVVVGEPSRRRAAALWLKGALAVAARAARPMPALAVTPSPPALPVPCLPPAAPAWRMLGSSPRGS